MEKIAGKIVQWLIKDSENEERAELYYYGVKEGLHVLINVLTMVVVGAIVGRLAECVLFYISYFLSKEPVVMKSVITAGFLLKL